jgi:hypothetical protein
MAASSASLKALKLPSRPKAGVLVTLKVPHRPPASPSKSR